MEAFATTTGPISGQIQQLIRNEELHCLRRKRELEQEIAYCREQLARLQLQRQQRGATTRGMLMQTMNMRTELLKAKTLVGVVDESWALLREELEEVLAQAVSVEQVFEERISVYLNMYSARHL